MLAPTTLPDTTNPLLKDYALGKAYDAMLAHGGGLRPGWEPVVGALDALGNDGLSARHEEIQRLLHENGVTFNMHDETPGHDRRIDPLPLIIGADQWRHLEAGLTQRSRLMAALYDDLYSERRTLAEGLLPARLIFAFPGFLPPCNRALPPGNAGLAFHGIDLVQDAQGEWRVMSDRLQAPAGTGFALENRILLARALPELYRDAHLRRLASFLDSYHRTLLALAPHHKEHPKLALLTPGPTSERYFEHAYLANYLNISLVESLDLVVRNSQVWLRTLGGLQPVDIILRACEDQWCDPLELRGDSMIGVPGLLQAVRAGNVVLSNPLGVGLLEHPGLAPYLPRLCQHLLGEPLRLSGPESGWCGDADALDWASRHFDTLEFRDLSPAGGSWRPAKMTDAEARALYQRLQRTPEEFLARRPIEPASVPAFDEGLARLASTSVNLRCFTALDPDSDMTTPLRATYRAMPGGLAWVGAPGRPSLDSDTVKDVWVMADAPQPHVSQLRQASGPIVVTRDGTDLPSRVAENLFWVGRYGERLDCRSRLMREAMLRLLEYDQDDLDDSVLDELFVALELIQPDATRRAERFALQRAQLLQLFAQNEPEGLPQLLQHLMRNGRAVRDHFGDDSWRVLNQLHQRTASFSPALGASAGRRASEHISAQLAAFFGLCNETMPHHYGWRFMDIGRFIERVLALLALLKLTLVTPRESGIPLWEVVLSTTDNFTAYRRRYRSELHPTAILDLLLFDEGNPRSVGYMLKRLNRQIERLPHPSGTPYRSDEMRLIIQATATLRLADISSLSELAQSSAAHQALDDLIQELTTPLSALSDAIGHSHFSHVERPRQLVKMDIPA